MTHKDYIQQVFEGNKPTPAVLKIAHEEMNKINLLLGQVIQLMGNKIPINNVGDALNFKSHMAAIPVTREFLQKYSLDEEDNGSFMKIKKIIAYWYARGWIDPLPDYGQPLISAKDDYNPYLSGDHKQQYLMGAKADQETLDMIRSYMDFTMINMASSGGSGPFMMTHIHGVGSVSGKYSPVERFVQLIRAGGAKMAKDCFDLEYLDDKNKIQQLYNDCFDILLFWTMKGWLKLPDLDEKDPFPNFKKKKVGKLIYNFFNCRNCFINLINCGCIRKPQESLSIEPKSRTWKTCNSSFIK